MKKELLGEFIGTFIIVLFGCGAVGGAVLFGAFTSLFEVALIWGFGVTIAIFCSRNFSSAHLNPAVSIAMTLAKKLEARKLAPYILAQFIGAFVGGLVLYALFGSSITHYETVNGIVRGTPESVVTAQMFGEFFPNPGFADKIQIGWVGAMLCEAFGTFLLVFVIFKLTEKEEQLDNTTPFFIGLTVCLIICLIAPFTQAGLNPARDFGPRLVAYLIGWGNAAFPVDPFSFFMVYILGPIIGGAISVLLNKINPSEIG